MKNTSKLMNCNSRQLTADHRDYFTERGISTEFALRNGARSVDGAEAAEVLGRRSAVPSGGILFEYPRTSFAYARFRADDPEATYRYRVIVEDKDGLLSDPVDGQAVKSPLKPEA